MALSSTNLHTHPLFFFSHSPPMPTCPSFLCTQQCLLLCSATPYLSLLVLHSSVPHTTFSSAHIPLSPLSSTPLPTSFLFTPYPHLYVTPSFPALLTQKTVNIQARLTECCMAYGLSFDLVVKNQFAVRMRNTQAFSHTKYCSTESTVFNFMQKYINFFNKYFVKLWVFE